MYEKFREAVLMYRKHSLFSTYQGNLNDLPAAVHDFYKNCNPIDVKIDYDGLDVWFCPAERLSELQEEYSYIDAQFVFATCNGDPIFLDGESVYTCSHDGGEKSDWEKLADSFESYIKEF